MALPATGESPGLERALASLRAQTRPPDEILVVLNGASTGLLRRARALASDLVRVIVRPEANLAAALNEALRSARSPLVARQDDDDESLPTRFELQRSRLERDPSLAGVGSAFERVGPEGRSLGVVRPPTEPGEIRWRLLLDNTFAHGSMMLRREAVLGVGGYDPSLERAQDYDLWLRLARSSEWSLANLPDVLYRFQVRARDDEARGDLAGRDQAGVAVECARRAWRDLPRHGLGASSAEALVRAWMDPRSAPASVRAIEHELSHARATSESLLALLVCRARVGSVPMAAYEAARRSRLREVGARLRSLGATEVTLWGAGEHSEWLVSREHDLGLRVRGLVDDHRAGEQRLGFRVRAPDSLESGEHALLSSDWHEDELWRSSAGARARGVRVHRLYADADPTRGSPE